MGPGPVGLLRYPVGAPEPGDPLGASSDAIAEVGVCMGAAGEVFQGMLGRFANNFTGFPDLPAIPGAPGDPNWFAGGAPIIRSFTIEGDIAAEIAPGATVTLAWQVENADTVEIVMVRGVDGDRNQLPRHPGGVTPGNGSWVSPPIPCDWSWKAGYELRATNRCNETSPVTASVFIRFIAPYRGTRP